MLMADDSSSFSWRLEDGLLDGFDDFSIDIDEFNRILSEDCDQGEDTKPPLQDCPKDLSCNNSFFGGVVSTEVNHWSQLELQNSTDGSEYVSPREDGLPESSEWCHSGPSESRVGMGEELLFDFPETSGMQFDHGKVHCISYLESPIRTGSVSLTDWSTKSCIEHDTCSSREREGIAMNAHFNSYVSSSIPTNAPGCSIPFNFASGDSSGCIDNVNLIDLKNEKENDSKCSSHFIAMEESDLGHNPLFENSMEGPVGLERTFYTSAERTFTDVNTYMPNTLPTVVNGNQVFDMHCEGGRSYTEHSPCDHSSTIADNGTFIDSKKFMPHCFDIPFMQVKEEKMTCAVGEPENQLLLSQKIRANHMINQEPEEVISGISIFPKASVMGFSNISKCQGTSPKTEASSNCYSIGIESSCDADDSSSSDYSRKSFSGSQSFMPRKKEMVSTEDDKRELHGSDYASYRPSKAVEGHSSSITRSSSCSVEDGPCADQASNQLLLEKQAVVSTKRLQVPLKNERKHVLHTVKDERQNEFIVRGNTNCHVKQNGVVKCNTSLYKSSVDEDDVCILEDISDPITVPSQRVHEESLITSLRSGNDHLGLGGTRIEAIDERITYRVALQDLSQPKSSEQSPPEGTLAVPLLRHQRIALAWMVSKENNYQCSGGILADDQGLGKTISTIALILTQRPSSSKASPVSAKHNEPTTFNLDDDDDDGGLLQLNGMNQDANSGRALANNSPLENDNTSMLAKMRPSAGTLIVCPTSVLRQWADELQSKVLREANLSVLVYHGSNRTKDPSELAKYDVVLTTYSIVSMEVPKQPLVDKDEDEKGQAESNGLPPMEFSSSKKRKYPPSTDKKSRKKKKGMDGDMLESIARPLARVGWFRVVLDEAQSIKNHRTQVARACWGLRAKRRWCLSGTPIQNSIDDLYSYFRFLKYDPYAAYKLFCSMIKIPISRNPTTGYKKLQAVLKTIMLRRTKGTFLDGEPIINLPLKSIELKRVDFSTDERDFYSKLEADSVAQFKIYAEAGTVKQNYVNILLMLLRLRQACDHPLLVKGYDSSSVWKSSVETAKKLAREKQITLLNCLEACSEICGICNDPPEDAVVTMCGHIFCNQCILEYLTGDENVCPAAQCKIRVGITSVFSRDTLRSSLSGHAKPENSASQPVQTLEACSQGLSESSKIKAALEVLVSLSKPWDCVSRNGSNNEITTDSCSEDQKRLTGSSVKAPEKAIVFSQWTRMLDLLEVHLKNSSIQYRRLDGTMSVHARDKAVKDFNTLPAVTVMIMSLKAASLGLNMVAACHVILLDLWWNPTTEDQAIDRAHRIGQTRPVSVLRLTVKDTVEDRILALQQKKRVMVSSAFGEDETGSCQTRLTVDDLKYLFMA